MNNGLYVFAMYRSRRDTLCSAVTLVLGVPSVYLGQGVEVSSGVVGTCLVESPYISFFYVWIE